MNKVYIVIDINLKVADDTSIPCIFASKADAFDYAIKNIVSVNGQNILIHNHQIAGYATVDNRISNGCSLGSDLGISYKSYYGSYPCARMIMEREVK